MSVVLKTKLRHCQPRLTTVSPRIPPKGEYLRGILEWWRTEVLTSRRLGYAGNMKSRSCGFTDTVHRLRVNKSSSQPTTNCQLLTTNCSQTVATCRLVVSWSAKHQATPYNGQRSWRQPAHCSKLTATPSAKR